MPMVSIIICAYNAAGRIAPVLEALARQRTPADLSWETLLIANACTDQTETVAAGLAGKMGLKLRIVVEPKAGLSHARRRGVDEAAGEIITFVDDDNIVCDDWVQTCAQFMREHPRAGLVGGKILPRFVDPASKPADFATKYAGALACWDHGNEAFQYPPPVHYPPCGAGLTMRRDILRGIYEKCGCHLTGRTGGRLVSGEDYELGLLALRMGWEAWYVPGLRMEHVLPPGRLTEDYLRRLRLGNAESERWLEYLRGKEPQRRRLWYLYSWFDHRRCWARMKFVGWMRRDGHVDSTNYHYWAEEQEMRAIGAWRLFSEYPFASIERGLARLSGTGAACADARVDRAGTQS